jgi:hypothetical protein
MTQIIKQSHNFLSKEHKSHIKELIEKAKLPFYMGTAFGKTLKYPYLSHVILKRPEDRNVNDIGFNSKYSPGNTFNSEYTDIFLDFLFAFCDKHKITINKIFRIAVNLTFNIKLNRCPSHIDHPFNHKQLIIYLNDCDKSAQTVLLKNNKITDKITPKKYKGVLFKKCSHYQIYPKKGPRIIAIYTFD